MGFTKKTAMRHRRVGGRAVTVMYLKDHTAFYHFLGNGKIRRFWVSFTFLWCCLGSPGWTLRALGGKFKLGTDCQSSLM